jgi:tetratricopeptide (TPR) repeat protein
MSPESRTKTITNPKSCFLNLSYTSGSSPSRIERILTDYFRDRGFEVQTGRMTPGGESNDRGILQVIKSSSFGIVVYNEFRHNIGYEWGLMDALGMPVIPFKDKNTHMDFDKDFSDKKGINFVHYSGDSDKNDIVKELESSDSLKNALGNVEKRIGENISPEETEEVKEASRTLTKSNISLGGISIDKERIKIPGIDQTLNVLSKVRKLTSEGHFYRAIVYYHANDFENAEKEYKKALEVNPHSAATHYNLGVLLNDLQRYEEAEMEYREVIRINPNFSMAHNNLGGLLGDLKRYEEAEMEYRQATRADPDHAFAHNNLGLLLAKLGRAEEAEKEYREAIRINPDYAQARNNLGTLLDGLKRYEEAEREHREAINLIDDLPDKGAKPHNNLGVVLYHLEKYEESEKELREVIRINSDYADAYYNLGILYSKTERVEEAKKELETAKRLFEEQGRAEDVKKTEELLKSL